MYHGLQVAHDQLEDVFPSEADLLKVLFQSEIKHREQGLDAISRQLQSPKGSFFTWSKLADSLSRGVRKDVEICGAVSLKPRKDGNTQTSVPSHLKFTCYGQVTQAPGIRSESSPSSASSPDHTGGKSAFTQQAHGEFIVSSETKCPPNTQQAHGEYF